MSGVGRMHAFVSQSRLRILAALALFGLPLGATYGARPETHYIYCYSYPAGQFDKVQALSTLSESQTYIPERDLIQQWLDFTWDRRDLRRLTERNGTTSVSCNSYSNRASAMRNYGEAAAKYANGTSIPWSPSGATAARDSSGPYTDPGAHGEITAPKEATADSTNSRQMAHEEVVRRNEQRQREYEAAIKAREDQIARDKAAHAAAVQRGSAAIQAHAEDMRVHQAELERLRRENELRQQQYRDELAGYQAQSAKQCPIPPRTITFTVTGMPSQLAATRQEAMGRVASACGGAGAYGGDPTAYPGSLSDLTCSADGNCTATVRCPSRPAPCPSGATRR